MPRPRHLAMFVCALVCACKAESEPMQAPLGGAPNSSIAPSKDDAAMPEAEQAARKQSPTTADEAQGDSPDAGVAPPPAPITAPEPAIVDGPTAVPGIGDAEPIIQGNLDRDIIRRVVKSHADEVQACYDEALRKNPNLTGTVKVEFTIDQRGRVRNSDADEGIDDSKLADCLADAVENWEFPEPGKGEVVVSYPFTLAPAPP